MCIIIYKPDTVAKATITRETLYNCWQANSDGGGIMFAHRGRMVMWKGLMTFDKFMSAWDMVPTSAVLVAHFRIGTHAKNDEANTHPFWVKPNELAMVHNGILPIKARVQDNMSDTATFVEDVLKALPDGWLQNPATMHLLDGYIGHNNKLVFLDRHGRVTILNEQAGTQEGGCWYSNMSHRRTFYTFTTTETPKISLRDRWKTKTKPKPKRDSHKETAVSLVMAARHRHKGDDAEVAREFGITLEELQELVIGTEDEAAIRALEAQVEHDARESRQD